MMRIHEPMMFGSIGNVPVGEPLHYTTCGLDNVYLVSGFNREKMDGEEYTSVDNVDGLYQLIALHLTVLLRPLRPQEIRFLRKYLNITQEELGKLFGVTRKSVVDYERDLELPRTSQIVFQLKVARHIIDDVKEQSASSSKVHSQLKSNLDTVRVWLDRVGDELTDWLLKIPPQEDGMALPPAFIADAAMGSWRIASTVASR